MERRAGASFYLRVGKRALDVVLVSCGILAGWPLILVVALLTRLNMGSPVLYRQVRPGLDGRPFSILKFRTMRDDHDDNGELLPDAERLTRFGRLLRTTSLDELPELFNVLRGEMSLVGPRPLLTRYLERYTPRQARRMEVRPGITGLAQVRGRNLVSWDERFELDVWYVDHCSLWQDLKILAQTVMTVLKREGIAADGHASMPEFMGSGNNDEVG